MINIQMQTNETRNVDKANNGVTPSANYGQKEMPSQCNDT